MAYCGPAGIPLGWFLGGDNRWDDSSRDAALAWQQEADTACHGCGQHRDEWVSVDEDGKPHEVRPAPYVVDEYHCPSCEALQRAQKAQSRDDDDRPGMHFRFIPIATASDDEDDG